MKKVLFFASIIFALSFLLKCKNVKKKSTFSVKTTSVNVSDTFNHKMEEVTPEENKEMCFLLTRDNDSTLITLMIDHKQVTGTMVWKPYQSHGAYGTLNGKKNSSWELELLYSYTIENTSQSEEKIFKIENEKLFELVGELEDSKYDGSLKIKDKSKAKFTNVYDIFDCSKIERYIVE